MANYSITAQPDGPSGAESSSVTRPTPDDRARRAGGEETRSSRSDAYSPSGGGSSCRETSTLATRIAFVAASSSFARSWNS